MRYTGNNLNSPNGRGELGVNVWYDYYVKVENVPIWAFESIRVEGRDRNEEELSELHGDTSTNRQLEELFQKLEADRDLKMVRSGDWGDGYRYAVQFVPNELAYQLSEYAYNREIGLYHMPLNKFQCIRCGYVQERREPHGTDKIKIGHLSKIGELLCWNESEKIE